MAPNWRNVKSRDGRPTDGHDRARNFLSHGEVYGLLEANKKGSRGVRDLLILLMMIRQGLRVGEVVRMGRQELSLKRAPV